MVKLINGKDRMFLLGLALAADAYPPEELGSQVKSLFFAFCFGPYY